jgi:hypothetical protein
MLKYENSTLKIYIRTIKHYTDIDPTVDFVFPVNKIDHVDIKTPVYRNYTTSTCLFLVFR